MNDIYSDDSWSLSELTNHELISVATSQLEMSEVTQPPPSEPDPWLSGSKALGKNSTSAKTRFEWTCKGTSYLKQIKTNIFVWSINNKDGSLTRGLPAYAGTARGNLKSKSAKTEFLQEMGWWYSLTSLQETLLELKGRNYSLEEQARKQKNALGEAEARVKVIKLKLYEDWG